jgi:signal transduction histidine kinase
MTLHFAAEDFRAALVERMRSEHTVIASRWLSRLAALLPVEPNDVFPSDHLLDHIPELVAEVADYIGAPANEEIAANAEVIAKARELGRLRYSQHASLHQIMREYRVFASVLTAFIREELTGTPYVPTGEVVDVMSRLHHAMNVLEQSTLDAFIERYSEVVSEQRQQLEAFNRMASHELRQPLGTLQFTVRLLQERAKTRRDRLRLLDVLARNVDRILELTRRMTRLSGLEAASERLHVQRVDLATLAQEVARQLRDMAIARQVTVRVSGPLPAATVDVGAVELILVNLVSNAIKYSDPAKPQRFVEIASRESAADECVIVVRDNGLGIPANKLRTLFRRPLRAHADKDVELGVEGLGLGLMIVNDCLRTIGGSIDVESTPGEGTTFTVRFAASGVVPGAAAE